MTSKVKGTEGIEFPDGSVQGSAAYSKAESDGPAFVATSGSGPLVPGNNVLTSLNELVDTNNCFANNKFTPNVAGYYQINMYCEISGTTGGPIIRKNGANIALSLVAQEFSPVHQTVSVMSYMNGTTDYFDFVVNSSVAVTLTSASTQGFLARRA